MEIIFFICFSTKKNPKSQKGLVESKYYLYLCTEKVTNNPKNPSKMTINKQKTTSNQLITN